MRIQVDQDIEMRVVDESENVEVFQTVDRNRRHLRKWLPWVDASERAEDYINVIKFWLQDIDNGVGLTLGMYYRSQFIGMCGFNTIDDNSKRVQVGYWIAKEYEGKGIVRRCVNQLIDYAFNTMHMNRIEIICGVDNKRSRKLPETLGFTAEATLKEYEYLYDHFHDCILYRLLKSEYERIN